MSNIIQFFSPEPVSQDKVRIEASDDRSISDKGFNDILQQIKDSNPSKPNHLTKGSKRQNKAGTKEEIESNSEKNADGDINHAISIIGFNRGNQQLFVEIPEEIELLNLQASEMSFGASAALDNQSEKNLAELPIDSPTALDNQNEGGITELPHVTFTIPDTNIPLDNATGENVAGIEGNIAEQPDSLFMSSADRAVENEDNGEIAAGLRKDIPITTDIRIRENGVDLPNDIPTILMNSIEGNEANLPKERSIAINNQLEGDGVHQPIILGAQIEENKALWENEHITNVESPESAYNKSNTKKLDLKRKDHLQNDLPIQEQEQANVGLESGIDDKILEVMNEKPSISEVRTKEAHGLADDMPDKSFLSDKESENHIEMRLNGLGPLGNGTKDNRLDFSKVLNKPDTAGQTEIIEQLAHKAIMTLKQNRSELEIRLEPEHLGKLTLKVTLEDGILIGKIFTSNERVKDFLQDNLENLRTTLKDQGLVFTSLDVDVGSQSSSNRFDHLAQSKPRRNKFDPFINGSKIGEERIVSSNLSTAGINPNQIDYLA